MLRPNVINMNWNEINWKGMEFDLLVSFKVHEFKDRTVIRPILEVIRRKSLARPTRAQLLSGPFTMSNKWNEMAHTIHG